MIILFAAIKLWQVTQKRTNIPGFNKGKGKGAPRDLENLRFLPEMTFERVPNLF